MRSRLWGASCTLALSLSFITSVGADILWDYSPGTTNGDGTKNWQNRSLEQNWAERISFPQDVYIMGMDVYSWDRTGMSVGDSVTVRVWTDATGTPDQLINEFSEPLSIIDLDGVGSISGINRKHVDFSNPVILSANTQYWIGMSGNPPFDLAQMGLSINPPDDSRMAIFDGITFGSLSSVGDMAFRLHGDTVPSVVRNPSNGHYYEFVTEELTWPEAKIAAESRNFSGLSGQLATITSENEQSFIEQMLDNSVIPDISDFPQIWIGGSDQAQEGIWEWVTGAESGLQFWEGDSNGFPIGDAYENWETLQGSKRQPDNLGNEDFLSIEFNPAPGSFPSDGKYQWNDSDGTRIGVGYLVEYEPAPEVKIDIKPGNKRNVINPRAKGSIWVAILSDTDAASPFDPSSQVDIPTVEFGPDGAKVVRYKVKDINKDGIGDLLLRFKIPETGIACGDTEATLTGETFEDMQFTGTDAVNTVGCN